MRNKSKRSLRGLVLFCLFFLSIVTKAQICSGFMIINNNGMCSITLDYKVFDVSTCAIICFGTNVTIGAANSITIPSSCATGGGGEDIEIILSTPASVPVNYGSGTGGGGSWTCYGPATMSDSGTGGCFMTGWNIAISCSSATFW